jgi:hypothetical protein
MVEPTDEPKIRVVPEGESDPAQQKSARLTAEVMLLLTNYGIDCSVAVEAVDEDAPRTLH